MSKELVSVIILNWNGKHLLDDCFQSVLKQTYENVEIIVVDNGSTDDSVKHINENYGQIELILNDENLGFAKGMNIGMKRAKGDYLIPLNTDIKLDKDFIKQMIEASNEPDVGMVSGKLIKADSLEGDLIDSTGHVVYKNRLCGNLGRGVHESQFKKEEYVFGASGAAPLYKREMLEDIAVNGEYYDENFFSFLEDIDLDWRAQLRGWKCKFAPSAIAFHWRGGTAVRRTTIVEKHNYKNRYLMILKNDSFLYFLKNLPQIVFTDIIKSSALLFRAPTALTGWFSVIKYLPGTLRKRSHIQKRRKVSGKEIEKLFKKFDYKNWFKTHITEDVYNIRN